MRPVIVACVVMMLQPLSAMAQLSPGKLHRSHAFLEGVENCTKCHDPKQAIAPDKCLACHTAIERQRRGGTGLHSRPDHRECRMCHVEHQGRDSELIYWEGGRDKFDHAQTGYRLEGKHASLKCNDCHQPRFIRESSLSPGEKVDPARTFLGLDTTCTSCHRDEHRGQLGAACGSCHTHEAWKPTAKFDHRKTAFELLGKHATVTCVKCHRVITGQPVSGDAEYQLFKPIPHAKCTDCHADAHKGQLGPACTNCHNETGWHVTDQASFDHSRTRYPLQGMHATVACSKCHSAGRPKSGLRFSECRDCHSDYHQGDFAKRNSKGACEECHTVEGFRPARFDMAQHDQTSYPLRGAHRAVPCDACHLSRSEAQGKRYAFEFAALGCRTCHKDPHKGEVDRFMAVGGCESCHNDESWGKVVFDHSRTTFALEGRHTSVACGKCHRGRESGPQKPEFESHITAKTCEACHDDIHRGQFASADGSIRCNRCHTTQGWKAEKFDHTADTRFVLDGAHREVPCAGCHPMETSGGARVVRYKPLEMACVSCHHARDLHEGSEKQ